MKPSKCPPSLNNHSIILLQVKLGCSLVFDQTTPANITHPPSLLSLSNCWLIFSLLLVILVYTLDSIPGISICPVQLYCMLPLGGIIGKYGVHFSVMLTVCSYMSQFNEWALKPFLFYFFYNLFSKTQCEVISYIHFNPHILIPSQKDKTRQNMQKTKIKQNKALKPFKKNLKLPVWCNKTETFFTEHW